MISDIICSSYRVICTENQELYPGKIFIDICRDGMCSHDCLFEMRKSLNPGVERIFNDSRGIMLKEMKNGEIMLIYTKHNDKMAQILQSKKRSIVDPLIIKTFREMRQKNCVQTISIPLVRIKKLAKNCIKAGKIKNSLEEKAVEIVEEEHRRKRIMEMKKAYYENNKYASNPHLRLMLNQRKYLGD